MSNTEKTFGMIAAQLIFDFIYLLTSGWITWFMWNSWVGVYFNMPHMSYMTAVACIIFVHSFFPKPRESK